jgi:ribosome-associated heat shock protein Hsp15
MEKVRADKWLWAIRLFKTRGLASDACNAGKVKLSGDSIKPAKDLKVGDTLTITKEQQRLTYKITKLIDKRVGAPEAQLCYEDLTPPEERETAAMPSVFRFPTRERGAGRPTKKERRDMGKLRGDDK